MQGGAGRSPAPSHWSRRCGRVGSRSSACHLRVGRTRFGHAVVCGGCKHETALRVVRSPRFQSVEVVWPARRTCVAQKAIPALGGRAGQAVTAQPRACRRPQEGGASPLPLQSEPRAAQAGMPDDKPRQGRRVPRARGSPLAGDCSRSDDCDRPVPVAQRRQPLESHPRAAPRAGKASADESLVQQRACLDIPARCRCVNKGNMPQAEASQVQALLHCAAKRENSLHGGIAFRGVAPRLQHSGSGLHRSQHGARSGSGVPGPEQRRCCSHSRLPVVREHVIRRHRWTPKAAQHRAGAWRKQGCDEGCSPELLRLRQQRHRSAVRAAKQLRPALPRELARCTVIASEAQALGAAVRAGCLLGRLHKRTWLQF
mmetsp:Transcript_3532/g.14668  ORF Transcript_3532/g.14668 Transcript_3532/m.14668 type:complete len:371 (+) Transcript_3532:484-1596(+)